jgi:hypothetical protein
MICGINPYGLVLSCYDLLSYPSGELFTSRFIAKIEPRCFITTLCVFKVLQFRPLVISFRSSWGNQMRMRMVGFAVLAICLVFCAIPAHAQTEMMLTGSKCSSCFDFAASRSSLVITLSETKPVLMTDSARATDRDDFDLDRVASDSGFGKGDLSSDYAPIRHHQRLEGDPLADRHRRGFDGDGDDDHDHHHKFGGGPGGHVDPPPVSPTPEPMSMLLFGTGLLVLGGTLRRRQRKVVI